MSSQFDKLSALFDNCHSKLALHVPTEIDNTDYAQELEKLNDQIGGFEEDIAIWESEIADFEGQLKRKMTEANSNTNDKMISASFGNHKRSQLRSNLSPIHPMGSHGWKNNYKTMRDSSWF